MIEKAATIDHFRAENISITSNLCASCHGVEQSYLLNTKLFRKNYYLDQFIN